MLLVVWQYACCRHPAAASLRKVFVARIVTGVTVCDGAAMADLGGSTMSCGVFRQTVSTKGRAESLNSVLDRHRRMTNTTAGVWKIDTVLPPSLTWLMTLSMTNTRDRWLAVVVPCLDQSRLRQFCIIAR